MSTTYLTLDEIKSLLATGLQDVKTQITAVAGVDSAIVADYISRTQKRTALVVAGFAAGEIDIPEFKACLEDEKIMLTGFLDTLEIIGKVDAQELFKTTATTIAGIIVKIILPAV